MTTRNTELQEVLAAALAKFGLELHTVMPGQILTYDANTHTARVQPVFNRKFRGPLEFVAKPLPPIDSAPVFFPGTRLFSIEWDLLPGDQCLLLFSERALDQYRLKGVPSDPQDNRRHELTDAIVVPLTTKAVTGFNATQTRIKINSAGNVEISGTANIEVDAPNIALGETLAATSPVAKATELIAAIDAMLAAGTPIPNDGGAGLLTTMTIAWNAAKAAINATKAKVE